MVRAAADRRALRGVLTTITLIGLALYFGPLRLRADSAWHEGQSFLPTTPAASDESPLTPSADSLLAQLSDPDPRVRRRALEVLESEAKILTTDLAARVRELAASDSDPIVQGRAQLLEIAWRLASPPIPPSTNPIPVGRNHAQSATPPTLHSTPPGPSRAEASAAIIAQDTTDRSVTSNVEAAGRASVITHAWWDDDAASEPDRPGHSAALASFDATAVVAPDDSLPPSPSPAVISSGDPDVLFRPVEQPFAPPTDTELLPDFDMMVQTLRDAPTGYSGPSGVAPTETQQGGHFVPVEDRWRVGLPYWDRYDKGHPPVDDYPYVEGNWYDPFNQNVLKGDYPLIGQHTFLNVTASSVMLNEFRSVPTPTTPFESTADPFQAEFFGNPQQYFYNHYFKLSLDLFHGNAAFKPVDWRVKVMPVFNLNYLDVNELGIVDPDVRQGTTRARQDVALEEWFIEKKLADLGPDYDFLSVRAGSQPFNSDFRGFIFFDINRGVRLFGTRNANRDQFNLAVFDQLEKETNSQLNTFHDREQTVVIANYYRQDFVFPGYTAQASFHYNNDGPSFEFDENDFLARPDPAGVFREHRVEAYYLGFAGEGHMGRINVSNAFYWALGRDSFNPLAGREQTINGQMAALELSYDRDWARFRTSFFWSSGDDNILDKEARGFDSILDNPAFAGGGFSYWQRQNLRLFGLGLVQRESLIPDLRSSKLQGQSNFVNPGLFLYNLGLDADITPKVKLINNVNFLWFHKTEILERFVFQDNIEHHIGVDLSTGMEYRPFLNDNVILVTGMALFLPGAGFDDLYGTTDPFTTDNAMHFDSSPMFQAFLDLALTF